MTGAPMPLAADAVVRFEETDEGDGNRGQPRNGAWTVAIAKAACPGDNVRPAGEDVRRGTTVLSAGTRLRPAEIGLFAALGRSTVAVHRRPRVAVVSTGDELAAPGQPLCEGQIRDSNTSTIAAMVAQLGAVPIPCGVARDSVVGVRERLAEAKTADLIVTSGGVSAGDYDVVKDVLRAEGEVAIWQMRMKPGKPLAFGRIEATPLLGLPGNPVAAAISFTQFGRPAILKMFGRRDLTIPTIEARLLDRVDNRGRRRHFVRARVEGSHHEGFSVRVAGGQGAGVLTSLVRANGLLVVPEDLEVAEPGMCLQVQLLDWETG
jgi:molybdopterin molybdotransferase